MADDEEIVDLEKQEKSPEDGKPSSEAKAAKLPPVPGPKAAAPAAADGLADLEKQVEDERRERARLTEETRRLAAERDQAIAFAQEAERRGVSTYELYTDNQIQAVTDQMEGLARENEAAMAEGDFKTAAQLNLKIGHLGGDLAQLKRDKAVFLQQRGRQQQPQQQQRQPQQRQPQQQPQLPTDPLERAIYGRTEPTKQFLRKHPELIRGDGSLKRSAIDAHEMALDEGYSVDTPGYFERIEKIITPESGQDAREQTAPRRPPAAGYAAPVARTSRSLEPGQFSADGKHFRPTEKMRRLAEEQGAG